MKELHEYEEYSHMDAPAECLHCTFVFDTANPANVHTFRTTPGGYAVKRNACPNCGEWYLP